MVLHVSEKISVAVFGTPGGDVVVDGMGWWTVAGTSRPKSGTRASAGTARYPIESVANASRILTMLAGSPQVKLSDIADVLEVSPSTAHRLLTTLEASGLLRQNPASLLYEAGEDLLTLARALNPQQHSRWDLARPYMGELSDRVMCTVNLVTLNGSNVAFVESVEAMTPLRVTSRQGAIMPAHCVSGGKVLLARLTDAELFELYPHETLPQMTEKSIGTREALHAEIRRVRAAGYGTNFGESEYGISGVAVAIVDASDDEVSLALAVSAPSSALEPARVKVLVDDLTQTAQLLGGVCGL